MIPKTLTDKLEKIQRQALKIIYGWNVDIAQVMAAKGIETLEERREAAVLKFALKNEEKEKFGKKWFKLNEESERSVRPTTRAKYKMPVCKTERMMNNPVVNMTRKLNEHYSS